MELLIQEDDMAPDSLVTFQRIFISITGLTIREFKAKARTINSPNKTVWWLNGFELNYLADNPFYELRGQLQ